MHRNTIVWQFGEWASSLERDVPWQDQLENDRILFPTKNPRPRTTSKDQDVKINTKTPISDVETDL